MDKQLIYSALRTPDGTIIPSLHRHDYRTYLDQNGKIYMIDGGTDYLRASCNGDEKFISVYSDEDYEKVRKYAYRTGYGKPGAPDYGSKRVTFFDEMTDEHLLFSISYVESLSADLENNVHYQLLLCEYIYRLFEEISIKEKND